MDDPRPAALIVETLISGIPSPELVGLEKVCLHRNPETSCGRLPRG